jgi:hypothetical protein
LGPSSKGDEEEPLKMDPTEGSETSAKLNLTPGKYPKENISHNFTKDTRFLWEIFFIINTEFVT